jgi:hypothetical protein
VVAPIRTSSVLSKDGLQQNEPGRTNFWGGLGRLAPSRGQFFLVRIPQILRRRLASLAESWAKQVGGFWTHELEYVNPLFY